MQHKRRLVVFVIFVLCMFFLMTFANGSKNAKIATRVVEFIDGFDNSVISSQTIEVGTDAEVPKDPTHKNYVFAGWYLYDDRDVKVTNFNNIMEDLKVIALYKGDINNNGIADENDEYYTVKFVDSLNNNVISSQTVLVGMDATAPAVPSHKGYTFTGWNRGYTDVESDITVKALYRKNAVVKYTVTFIDGDTNQKISVQEVEKGATATLPETPKHENRVFVRWDGKYTNITKDVTITAIYADDKNNDGIVDEEQAHYTITYVDYDGEVLGEFKEVLVNTETPKLENEPTRNNYKFNGWDPTVATTVTGNATYTATYEPINDKNNNGKADEEEAHYTIKYVDYDGKTLGEFKEVLVNTATPTITNPTREYYTFDKWTPSVAATVTGNATYTATYEPINDKNNNGKADEEEAHYTITYVDYNGEEIKTFTNVLVNTATPTITNPTREYYTFEGWNPSVATTVTKSATYKATYKPINDKNNDGIADEEQTLWEVKFYGFDGTTQLGDVQYVIDGEDAKAPQAPTVKGYTFTKWDKEFTNVKSNLDVKAIYVDTEAPVIDAKVVLYNEKDGSYQNANITATVTDNDSVAEVRYLLGEHQLADYDKATVMNKSADGTYQINGLTKNSVYTIFAKDATGNISVKYVEVEGITVLEGDFEDLYAKGTFGELTGFPVIGTYRKNLSIVTKSDVKIVDARVYYGSSYKTVADFEKNPNLGTAIKHDDTKLSYQIEGSFLERVTIYVKYAEEVEVAPGVTETKYVSKVYTTRLTYWFNDAK